MYVVESIKNIQNSIEDMQYVNILSVINKTIKLRPINIQKQKNICTNLINKSNLKKVSIKIILANRDIIGKLILYVINKSFGTDLFLKVNKKLW